MSAVIGVESIEIALDDCESTSSVVEGSSSEIVGARYEGCVKFQFVHLRLMFPASADAGNISRRLLTSKVANFQNRNLVAKLCMQTIAIRMVADDLQAYV